MAISYNTGTVKSVTPGATASDVGSYDGSQNLSTRRLYNFGDRVAELTPEESPFFVYLSGVSKVPTDDPSFRFLENRTKMDYIDRSFRVETVSGSTGNTTIVADTNYTFQVEKYGSAASVDWLIKGMVFACQTLKAATTHNNVIVRVESGVTDGGAYSEFTGRVIDLGNTTDTGYNVVTGNTAGANTGDKCQVIGTSFGEGSGAPDVFASTIEDDFGYCQIFKTAAELSNSAIATVYRGYANEWDRIWNLKLREHKVDIERAMLFGVRATRNNQRYTEGIVGHIIANGGDPVNDGTQLSFNSGSPYLKTQTVASLSYDDLLSDFEVIFDPARGGQSEKLALASLPVISYFNKLGGSGFLQSSIIEGSGTGIKLNADLEQRTGAFGHKVLLIETIHGSIQLVKEPLFRNLASGYMCLVDMAHVAYRPLVGNGVNRDTHILTNVQAADEDLRKDMIITEAGLEISLPETHALWAFSDI